VLFSERKGRPTQNSSIQRKTPVETGLAPSNATRKPLLGTGEGARLSIERYGAPPLVGGHGSALPSRIIFLQNER
jgi:hypothetical protein